MPWDHVLEHVFLLGLVWWLTRNTKRRRGTKAKPREVRMSKRRLAALDAIPPVTLAWLVSLFRC